MLIFIVFLCVLSSATATATIISNCEIFKELISLYPRQSLAKGTLSKSPKYRRSFLQKVPWNEITESTLIDLDDKVLLDLEPNAMVALLAMSLKARGPGDHIISSQHLTLPPILQATFDPSSLYSILQVLFCHFITFSTKKEINISLEMTDAFFKLYSKFGDFTIEQVASLGEKFIRSEVLDKLKNFPTEKRQKLISCVFLVRHVYAPLLSPLFKEVIFYNNDKLIKFVPVNGEFSLSFGVKDFLRDNGPFYPDYLDVLEYLPITYILHLAYVLQGRLPEEFDPLEDEIVRKRHYYLLIRCGVVIGNFCQRSKLPNPVKFDTKTGKIYDLQGSYKLIEALSRFKSHVFFDTLKKFIFIILIQLPETKERDQIVDKLIASKQFDANKQCASCISKYQASKLQKTEREISLGDSEDTTGVGQNTSIKITVMPVSSMSSGVNHSTKVGHNTLKGKRHRSKSSKPCREQSSKEKSDSQSTDIPKISVTPKDPSLQKSVPPLDTIASENSESTLEHSVIEASTNTDSDELNWNWAFQPDDEERNLFTKGPSMYHLSTNANNCIEEFSDWFYKVD